ncbi:hypothetical protein ASG12_00055 [Williamsia sp. Leaf354]|uniref:hypothetical protein n=1 Tax=Williamsia sp. Leaf354 TaxID=1736349 RepID=UPI0006FC0B05|nr:hypothetical protein [Williamsia sp. Leaf354]KQR99294.1 hypothetical protein ASG12_00055 [Williamsia sp. Leaf354]
MSRNDIDDTADAQAADIDDAVTDGDAGEADDEATELLAVAAAEVPGAAAGGPSVAQAASVATSRQVPRTRGVVLARGTARVRIRRV